MAPLSLFQTESTDRMKSLLAFLFPVLVSVLVSCRAPGSQEQTTGDEPGRTASEETRDASGTAFLVLAPDRGFLGNERIREAVNEYRDHHSASTLAFVTRENPGKTIKNRVHRLKSRHNPDTIVALPLFLSENHVLYRDAMDVLDTVSSPQIEVANPMGASYLVEEILFDRLEEQIEGSTKKRLVIVVRGATNRSQADAIRNDLKPMVQNAVDKYNLAGGSVGVLADGKASRAFAGSATDRVLKNIRKHADDGPTVVIPFNLNTKYTRMMWAWNGFKRHLSDMDVKTLDRQILPHPNVVLWLRKASNRHLPLSSEEVGVVFVPHGSDYHWNERMRSALDPLRDRYTTVDAFSMVGPAVLQNAVNELEKKNVRAAVVVRIFSLTSSFHKKARYILGLSRETARYPSRVESHLQFSTVGGLEDSPHFAAGLADRVREISQNPEKETIVLLGHGTGPESGNERWLTNLESLCEQMMSQLEGNFRGCRYQTWREDWPEKQEESVTKIRDLMEEANKNDGTALVIPARTTARGHGREYLEEFDYRYGTGFAPHPRFVEWVEEQIKKGIQRMNEKAVPHGRQR